MCLNTLCPCNCLTGGDPCEPCQMTAKEKETEVAHLSSNVSATGTSCELNITSSVVRERVRNWGWLVSGIICLNVLLLGCALVSGSAYNNVDISSSDVQVFLIILILLTSTWMVYYIIYTVKKEDAVVYKDSHAGPVWLRGK